MNKIKVCIESNVFFGKVGITFSKEFILPFIPYYGMELYDSKGDDSLIINLDNDEYNTTIIGFDLIESCFYIDTSFYYKDKALSINSISIIVEDYISLGWVLSTTCKKALANLTSKKEKV